MAVQSVLKRFVWDIGFAKSSVLQHFSQMIFKLTLHNSTPELDNVWLTFWLDLRSYHIPPHLQARLSLHFSTVPSGVLFTRARLTRTFLSTAYYVTSIRDATRPRRPVASNIQTLDQVTTDLRHGRTGATACPAAD